MRRVERERCRLSHRNPPALSPASRCGIRCERPHVRHASHTRRARRRFALAVRRRVRTYLGPVLLKYFGQAAVHSGWASRTFLARHQSETLMRAIFERSPSRRTHLPSLVIALGALLSTACGDAGERPASIDSTAQSAQANPDGTEPVAETTDTPPITACTDGTTMACRIQLPTQGTTQNCFVGIRTCVSGAWSLCHDPSEPPPSSGR
jgi:hypothetical protein